MLLTVSYRPIDLDFTFPVQHGLKDRSKTEAFVVKVSDGREAGYGEGTPRDYVTGETLENCLAELSEIAKSVRDLQEFREKASSSRNPSVSCALESAYLDLLGKKTSAPIWKFFVDRQYEYEYSAVVPLSPPSSLLALIQKYDIPFVKLKVSPEVTPEETAAVAKKLGRRQFRLDANGTFSIVEAVEFVLELRELGVFITDFEQPVRAEDLDGLREVEASTRVPVIADESLTLDSFEEFMRAPYCAGLNLRLSKCGGISSTLAAFDRAVEKGYFCQLGSHVGETSILSALQYHAASCRPFKYVEGGYSSFVLKKDLAKFEFAKSSADISLGSKGLGLEISF